MIQKNGEHHTYHVLVNRFGSNKTWINLYLRTQKSLSLHQGSGQVLLTSLHAALDSASQIHPDVRPS